MTKTHFESIADVLAHQIKTAGNDQAKAAHIDTAKTLAERFKADYPRFKKTAFLARCKVTQ